MKPFVGFVERMKVEAWAWRAAWRQIWQERCVMDRKRETIVVPLGEYCVLLQARERELKAHSQLGELQETVRVLRGRLAARELAAEDNLVREISSGCGVDYLVEPRTESQTAIVFRAIETKGYDA